MAIILKSPKTTFEPFQIVIDIDSPEKAMLYGKIFGDPARVSHFIGNLLNLTDVQRPVIKQILEDEFTAEEWMAAFAKQMP